MASSVKNYYASFFRKLCSLIYFPSICKPNRLALNLYPNLTYNPTKQLLKPFILISLVGIETVHIGFDNVGDNQQMRKNKPEPSNNNASVGVSVGFKPSKSYAANDPELSSSRCLQNAVGLSVDATSAVLSQTIYQIIDVEKQYIELVNVLITLLEYQIKVLGYELEEQRMADLIVEARNEMNEVYKKKQDLALLFSSVEKLAEATAEVAFAAGADYASISSSDRLYSALLEKKRLEQASEEAEHKLRLIQVQVIQKTTKHEEEKQQREAKRKNSTAAKD